MAYRLITPPSKQRADKSPTDKSEPKEGHRWRLFFGLIVTIVTIILIVSALRPLPSLAPVKYSIQTPGKSPVQLAWPSNGQSAIGAVGYGLLETNGEQVSVPMASVAKVVTALAVLQKKPLAAGQQGPTLTMTDKDVAIFNKYYSEGGSNVVVQQGEQLTEYQALQALLLPSANNIADSLAIWAFDSVDNYTAYANGWLEGQHLDNTTMADASGFSEKTVSSSSDLVRIGELAINNPVLADIVKQEQANLPVAGTVSNTNWLLNEDGVIGIKTGNTEQAKGCYLFASKRTVDNHPITIIGAVMGAPDLNQAISSSKALITSTDSGFKEFTLVRKGKQFGEYIAPWGTSSKAVAQNDVKALLWQNTNISQTINLANVDTPASSGQKVGSVKFIYGDQSASSSLVLGGDIRKPPLTWRIFH